MPRNAQQGNVSLVMHTHHLLCLIQCKCMLEIHCDSPFVVKVYYFKWYKQCDLSLTASCINKFATFFSSLRVIQIQAIRKPQIICCSRSRAEIHIVNHGTISEILDKQGKNDQNPLLIS